MKKFISLITPLALALSVSGPAFAVSPLDDTPVDGTPDPGPSIELVKVTESPAAAAPGTEALVGTGTEVVTSTGAVTNISAATLQAQKEYISALASGSENRQALQDIWTEMGTYEEALNTTTDPETLQEITSALTQNIDALSGMQATAEKAGYTDLSESLGNILGAVERAVE